MWAGLICGSHVSPQKIAERSAGPLEKMGFGCPLLLSTVQDQGIGASPCQLLRRVQYCSLLRVVVRAAERGSEGWRRNKLKNEKVTCSRLQVFQIYERSSWLGLWLPVPTRKDPHEKRSARNFAGLFSQVTARNLAGLFSQVSARNLAGLFSFGSFLFGTGSHN